MWVRLLTIVTRKSQLYARMQEVRNKKSQDSSQIFWLPKLSHCSKHQAEMKALVEISFVPSKDLYSQCELDVAPRKPCFWSTMKGIYMPKKCCPWMDPRTALEGQMDPRQLRLDGGAPFGRTRENPAWPTSISNLFRERMTTTHRCTPESCSH